MDRKELFQKNVEKAVFDIADFMISKSENNMYVGRAESIKKALKINHYVYCEASGRLRAIGFHTGVKQFTANQMYSRKDRQEYYFSLNPDRHPKNIINTDEGINLLAKRQKKLARDRASEMAAFLMYGDLIEKYNSQDHED